MWTQEHFRVLHVDLTARKSRVLEFGNPVDALGGSGLAAALYDEYGLPQEPAHHPDQPLIFAIGPLTGYYPLMSKVVCAFKSPYHEQYAESHAGGRMALAMRFAGYHALMITGRAATLSVLQAGSRSMQIKDVHYLRGKDVFSTGKLLRSLTRSSDSRGHRSIIRIGPAGEKGSSYACINVDTYRHFGRLGAGAIMGLKNLKAVAMEGDADFQMPGGKAYAKIYKDFFQKVTATDMMRKYHDLGTPQNLIPLNELKSLPWRNLQATSDPAVDRISGETFAEELLLRQTACAGCPVGCVHIGLLRQQFAKDHEFLYRQVSYDYEPIFAMGSMLGLDAASNVLVLLEETEKVGLDVMSAGVALAWATEALDTGLISEKETLVPLRFGDVKGYAQAIRHLGLASNDFYKTLAQGSLVAAEKYGGGDFACVLGQEMAGYATGEVYFASQATSFRHSHLDTGAYSYDQKRKEQDTDAAVKFLVEDEQGRMELCSMVSCLFARSVYTHDALQEALAAVELTDMADNLTQASANVQQLRWKLKIATGFDPHAVKIPKRFTEVETWRGKIDETFMWDVQKNYADAIMKMAST
ncbi:aldehyde ferredoxin oxidoreductase [Oceanidesulfovibrio indonesiensis]|uniref:Aldehyde ferredoxin oxidoreductase n=1 Tax=Oceanidesulfovibrio indonesiensis TaxID=54767 RepID=A0A7M3MGJ3_9BACT|nr:aldehyde ferredoxin oxidoreductase N-terminal domain-containing protein [Oceanidesulfovibrio indonesiensis]TVM17967.1 aldehyde ferredoxin oxidoreductase [Oceanidesulfovibrio indonesiensis]